MVVVTKRSLFFFLASVLLGAASRAQAFPFCFSDGNNRWSDSDWRNTSWYPSRLRAGYWPGDYYPPIPYSQPLVPTDIRPVVVEEAQVPALPVEIPNQHIFR